MTDPRIKILANELARDAGFDLNSMENEGNIFRPGASDFRERAIQMLASLDATDPRDEVIRGLVEALKPLIAIADAFDANELDDEARKFWGQHGVNTTPHENIELYAGRGGKELLTLADCMLARKLVRQPYMGQIMAECDCPRQDECQRAGRCIAEVR